MLWMFMFLQYLNVNCVDFKGFLWWAKCIMLLDKKNRSLDDVMAYLLDMDCNSKQITGFLDTWYAFKISKYIYDIHDIHTYMTYMIYQENQMRFEEKEISIILRKFIRFQYYLLCNCGKRRYFQLKIRIIDKSLFCNIAFIHINCTYRLFLNVFPVEEIKTFI